EHDLVQDGPVKRLYHWFGFVQANGPFSPEQTRLERIARLPDLPVLVIQGIPLIADAEWPLTMPYWQRTDLPVRSPAEYYQRCAGRLLPRSPFWHSLPVIGCQQKRFVGGWHHPLFEPANVGC